MVLKPVVKNWHREAYAKGETQDIPADALAELNAEREKRVTKFKEAKPAKEEKAE